MNQDPAHPLWPYARGYWLAAEAIAGQVLTEGVHHDLFVHPLVFLYCQAIELDLKHLIAQGRPLVGRPRGFPHGHDLLPLWHECRSIILQLDASARADADRVGTIIAEFSDEGDVVEGVAEVRDELPQPQREVARAADHRAVGGAHSGETSGDHPVSLGWKRE